jgi:hypothetical protein
MSLAISHYIVSDDYVILKTSMTQVIPYFDFFLAKVTGPMLLLFSSTNKRTPTSNNQEHVPWYIYNSACRLMGSRLIESAVNCNQIWLAQLYINRAQNTSVN